MLQLLVTNCCTKHCTGSKQYWSVCQLGKHIPIPSKQAVQEQSIMAQTCKLPKRILVWIKLHMSQKIFTLCLQVLYLDRAHIRPTIQQPKDVLVKVLYASLNPADIKLSSGQGHHYFNCLRKLYSSKVG